jgi:N-acetylneuraminic acid mutarotase
VSVTILVGVGSAVGEGVYVGVGSAGTGVGSFGFGINSLNNAQPLNDNDKRANKAGFIGSNCSL